MEETIPTLSPPLAETLLQLVGHIMQSGLLRSYHTLLRGESCVLLYLSQRSGGIHPTELHHALGISSARVAALLGAMLRKDLISRITVPDDRRKALIVLTDEGRARADFLIEQAARDTTHLLEQLGPADSAEFVRLLQRIDHITSQSTVHPGGKS